MKRGVFSLITYILYTLFWGGLSSFLLYALRVGNPGLAGIAVGIVLMVTIPLAIGSLIAVVVKIIHMATGWKLFGILCVLLDVYLVYTFVLSIISVGAITGATFILLICLTMATGSLVSNIKSLGN